MLSAGTAQAANPSTAAALNKKFKNFDADKWNSAHADLLSQLPQCVKPPPGGHGEHSYTVPIVHLGQMFKVEVHVRQCGYRVIEPKGFAPVFHSWKGWDPTKAWESVVKAFNAYIRQKVNVTKKD